MTLDPAALQVLVSRLGGIADEMGAVLRRSASSPNIKERADCSAAVFTAAGELLAQAEHIPVHLGSMPASVRAAIDAYAGELDPGDHVVVNDPFAGGTHLNDITVVTPAFAGRDLVGWAANRAHHADVGGAAPGFDPGRRHRHPAGGVPHPADPLQPRAARPAARRVAALRRNGPVTWTRSWAPTWSVPPGWPPSPGPLSMRWSRTGSAACAPCWRALPDGRWTFEDVIDSTGSAPDQQRPARIAVTVTLAGDEITFDFTGTDRQARGNVNAVEAVTVSAVAFALRTAIDPTIPANGGSLRPVHVIAPAGTIVAAQLPAAVGAGNVEVSQRIADVCLGALAQALPERVGAAGQGTMNNVLIGGDDWVYYETVGGGEGAPAHPRWHERRPHRDDQHAQHAHRGAGAGASRCGCCATGCARGAGERDGSGAARASSGTCRCSRPARSA